MIQSARLILNKPPSSSGPGRSPFKAKTGVRISVGALTKKDCIPGDFCFVKPEPPWRGWYSNLRGGTYKKRLHPRRFLFRKTGAPIEGMAFESPWGHLKKTPESQAS